MPYQLVETTEDQRTDDVFVSEPRPPKPQTWGTPLPRAPEHSRQVLGHSTWRCTACRALAVTRKGDKPPGKCGKCGR